MNKIIRRGVVVFVVAVALTGCAKTAPIHQVQHQFSAVQQQSEVRDAILKAGAERDWVMAAKGADVIEGRLIARDHSANIRINYNSSGYSISYVGSNNLLAGDGKIHRNYNRWVNNLDKDIQVLLGDPLIK